MKIQKIDDIKAAFHDEWLLVTVDRLDSTTGHPLMGTLVNHSKSVDEMWREAEKHSEPVMVLYSDDWPEDLAACFVQFR